MEEKILKIMESTKEDLKELGFSLYYVEYVNEEGENFLRFYIEHLNNDEAITLDDCERASRRLSTIIDELDPIEDQYIMEVSSTGIFKPLFTHEQRLSALNERVALRLKEEAKGKKNFTGLLKEVREDKVIIFDEEKNKDWEIKVEDILTFTLNPEI